jgi:hypothetical protein
MLSRQTAALWPAVFLCVLLVWPNIARADEPDHRGAFVRLALGMDYGAAVSRDDSRSQLRGGSGLGSFDFGFTLVPRLALHVRFAGRTVFSPRVSLNGEGFRSLPSTSLACAMVGPGFTYYAPSNWYLTYAMGAAKAKIDVGGEKQKSLIGYGFETDLGREWGTGGDFALGLAGRLSYYSVPQFDDGHVKWMGFGLLLTATYH